LAACHYRSRLREPAAAVHHDGRFRGYIRQAIEAAGNRTTALFDEAARCLKMSQADIEAGIGEIISIGVRE
jgi:hypothetical protein